MPGVGVRGVGVTGGISLGARIAALFRGGEQGAWYDPSDITALFQDAAGTTPVTAMEQPVGLILDKSKGLALGPERAPLVTSLTGWIVQYAPANGSVTTEPGGIRFTANGNGILALTTGSTLTSTKTYEVVLRVSDVYGVLFPENGPGGASFPINTAGTYTYKINGRNNFYFRNSGADAVGCLIEHVSIRELSGNHAFQSASTSRPVLSARVNQYLNTATLSTQNVTTLATTYTLRFEGAGSITLSGTVTGTYTAGAHSVVCTAGTLTSTVTGTVTNADLRQTNAGANLPPYQWVNTPTDYDTSGYPVFLRFDGIDDFLVTNSIDFTSTDKMTACAGVRKLSDATYGQVVELSVDWFSNNGTFALSAPFGNASSNYAMVSKGTSAVSSPATYAAPHTAVLTGFANISAPLLGLKVNGGGALTNPTPQGTGNYGNYPLYIGSRAGTALRFNGHLYSLIVRGAQSSDAQIASVERYVNGKTKAYA